MTLLNINVSFRSCNEVNITNNKKQNLYEKIPCDDIIEVFFVFSC